MADKEESSASAPQIGRPPFEWTEEIEDTILSGIMAGESVISMTGPYRPEGMPSQVTFYKRLLNDEAFAKRYARAKELLADHEFDEMREIADNASNDWMERNDPDNPGWVFNHDHVQRSKLRIDTRKWRASKLAPKKYGERVELEHSGEVKSGGAMDLSKLTTDDLLKLRELSAKAAPDESPKP